MFSDYARNAIRMAALMKINARSTCSRTTPSASARTARRTSRYRADRHLRMVPNLDVWRPVRHHRNLRRLAAARRASRTARPRDPDPPEPAASGRDFDQIKAIRKGGYVLKPTAAGTPKAVIIATGSEVALAIDAQKALAEKGIAVRVVSMPSIPTCSTAGRRLPQRCCRAAFRAWPSRPASPSFWYKYVGLEGAVIGIDRFGESAPAGELFQVFRHHRGQCRCHGQSSHLIS
jgi:transketolase